ncbi:cell division protein FtsZ [Flavobacteriales bacterium]|nr:cell division protein FtsZ [Flavobacteriales bacterium]
MAKEMMNFNLPQEGSSIIKVIGVGGGGSNAVNHMYKQGIKGVDFVVCNTDQQALDTSPVPKKIALGSSLTEGRGAGAQAEVGRNAAIENLDDIKELLEGNTKMVFITAGMGGGTGTGAAPIIAEAAKELGILTVGIVTVPFTFEGKKRKMQAEKGLEELKKHVDTVLVICNDKLRDMYGNLKLGEAFSQADDVLSIAAKGIAEIITIEGYVNVDFEDVRTVMTSSGVAIMGSATTAGEDRATKAVEQALASPLLNDNNIFGASNILLYISSGKEEVTMDEVAEITDYIQEEAGMDADVIWGNGTDLDLEDKLTLTIIATGFSGDKLEKVAGNENVVRHVLDTRRQAPTSEPKTEQKPSIPAGLTTRPVLLNSNMNGVEDHTTEMSISEPTPIGTEEPVIKYQLMDDEPVETLKEESTPPLMAFKVDETDKELNAILDAEAPEMIGVKVGEELPVFNDDEYKDENLEAEVLLDTEFVKETITNDQSTEVEPTLEVTETPSANLTEKIIEEAQEELASYTTPEIVTESVEETKTLNFNFSAPIEGEVEGGEKTNDNIITTETATEFELDLDKKEPELKEEKKTFNLYEDTPETTVKPETNELSEEPKLITRNTPINDGLDTEELQKKQQERMERLKNMNQRFRSPTNLAELENIPAFKRRSVNLHDTPHSSESSISGFEVTDGNDLDENGNKKGGLSDGNDFLHKSVD